MEPVEWIVVGAEVLRHPALPSNGAIEPATECDTIDLSRMDAKTNDPARELIHDHQDPVGPQRGRRAPEQIHTPKAFVDRPQKRLVTPALIYRNMYTGIEMGSWLKPVRWIGTPLRICALSLAPSGSTSDTRYL